MRRLAVVLGAVLGASALAWTVIGGIDASAQQSPAPTEIHRAHKGSFIPAPNKPIFILVLGSDAGAPRYGRGGSAERGRADSIHVLAINPKENTASMIGIPRDAFVPIPGHGSHKINAAMFFGGPPLVVRTIEGISPIRFDYYMLTNFEDFISMAAEFGGLTIKVPYPMHDVDSSTDFDAGVRHLDAGRVLGFARNRHNAPHGDFDRSLNQGTILSTAHAEARRRLAKDPFVSLQFLKILRRHIATDIPLAEQFKLGLLALRVPSNKVFNMVTPGGTATTSDGSSVILNARAYQMLRDIAGDGIVQSR